MNNHHILTLFYCELSWVKQHISPQIFYYNSSFTLAFRVGIFLVTTDTFLYFCSLLFPLFHQIFLLYFLYYFCARIFLDYKYTAMTLQKINHKEKIVDILVVCSSFLFVFETHDLQGFADLSHRLCRPFIYSTGLIINSHNLSGSVEFSSLLITTIILNSHFYHPTWPKN